MYLHQQLIDNIVLLNKNLPKLQSKFSYSITNCNCVVYAWVIHRKRPNTITKLRYQRMYNRIMCHIWLHRNQYINNRDLDIDDMNMAARYNFTDVLLI